MLKIQLKKIILLFSLLFLVITASLSPKNTLAAVDCDIIENIEATSVGNSVRAILKESSGEYLVTILKPDDAPALEDERIEGGRAGTTVDLLAPDVTGKWTIIIKASRGADTCEFDYTFDISDATAAPPAAAAAPPRGVIPAATTPYECRTVPGITGGTFCNSSLEEKRTINGKCMCVAQSAPAQPGEKPAPPIGPPIPPPSNILGTCQVNTTLGKSFDYCDQNVYPDTEKILKEDICYCAIKGSDPEGAAAAVKVDICKTGGSCSTGLGLICDLDSGKPIALKPNQPPPPNSGVLTAIGCIPSEPRALIQGVLRYGTLAAGGIAFILMILASLQMITAEGNPEHLKEGRDKFYSAIIGLLLIIFSVLLMQVIGVDILDLPGFEK